MFVALIDSDTLPSAWKKATVIPIPKISKPMGPEDLRPISLLPLPGKMFEHLRTDRGSQRGAVHSGTSLHNDDRCNGMSYIFG